VDDAGAVRLGKSLGDLDGEIEQAPGGQRLARGQELPQRLSLHELHRDVERPLGFADVVDRQDVRVVQGRRRAGLLLEAEASRAILGDGLRQHLDRDLAAELRVPRPVHLAHPSRAERRDDLVRPQAGSGCDGHQRSPVAR
jgi:hypothetical protein